MNFRTPFTIIFLIFIPTTLSHTPKPLSRTPSPSLSFSTHVHHRLQPAKASIFSPSKIYSDVQPNNEFVTVIRLGIGTNATSTPMLITELIIDTGSSLTWVQALPCNSCYAQGHFPYYNRFASQTYKPINCADEICRAIPRAKHNRCPALEWNPDEPCSYITKYMDGTVTSGVIGTETFYFQDPYGLGNESIPSVPFGLGTSNEVPHNLKLSTPGLLGLTRGPGTFLNALRVNKFSHCFPRGKDDIGILSFGSHAKIIGKKVTLNPSSIYYMAHLTNVHVAGNPISMGYYDLPIEMIFDTGVSWSTLDPEIMESVVEAIKSALRKFQPLHVNGHELCYDLIELCSISLDEVAKVTYEFNYSTQIDLFSFHLWVRDKERNMICLGLRRGPQGLNIFGNNLMREMNIGYVLDGINLAMYFNRQRCWR